MFNPIPPTIDSAKFWRRVRLAPLNECWLFGNNHSYGSFVHDGRCYLAHRVAYTLVRGEIPAGLVLDHLCRRHDCVNPFHLEPVSNAENIRRGLGVGHPRRRIVDGVPICKHGHQVIGDNARPTTDRHGSLYNECVACESNRNRIKVQKRKLARLSDTDLLA